MEVVTLDSGQRQHFETGAQRDTSENKPRFDLIPLAVLNELQQLYGGAPLEVDRSNPPITDFLPEDECRYDLIPDIALNRLAALYQRGAKKYNDNNWQRGIPLSRVYESLDRHEKLWIAGDTKEDHLAAIIWNAITLMWTEWAITHDVFPDEVATKLSDAGPLARHSS